MTTTVQNLEQYQGKKIIVSYNDAEGVLQEIEGTAETANELGILLKPKGKSTVQIIDAVSVETVEIAPEKDKSIRCRWVKDVEVGGARAHLAQAHGFTLSSVNSMTEEVAFEQHKGVDHSDLGHQHGEKPAKATPAAEAPASE